MALESLADGDEPLPLDMQAVYDTHFFEQRWGISKVYPCVKTEKQHFYQWMMLLSQNR